MGHEYTMTTRLQMKIYAGAGTARAGCLSGFGGFALVDLLPQDCAEIFVLVGGDQIDTG